MVKVAVAVAEWPVRFPRAAASTTTNSSSQHKHFEEAFPNRELDSITREEFKRFALVHPGAARYAKTLLADYTDAGHLEANVAEGVPIPRQPKKKVIIPTVDEVKLLSRTASNLAGHSTSYMPPPMALMSSMIEVAAYTGLREGEQRALSVVDMRERGSSREILVAEVEYSIDRTETLKAPKTARSRDTFTFLGRAPIAMRVAVDSGRYYSHSVLSTDHTPVREGRIWPITRAQRQAAWDQIRERAGVGVTWHSLRHFCATYLLDKGAPIDDVALQLRCTVQEIRDTYGHPDRAAALARLRQLV